MPSNKPSGTKSSPYEKQLREIIFFLDRNLGRKWAAEALRQAGAQVEIHDDHFAPDVHDEEWLAFCGRQGWIVLTLDYRICYRSSELDALERNKVKAFLIARAGQMNKEELSNLLVRELPKFVARVLQTSAPFAYRVTPSGLFTQVPLHRS
jgi:predicted nuclease of predicted toxin-antitoxin system